MKSQIIPPLLPAGITTSPPKEQQTVWNQSCSCRCRGRLITDAATPPCDLCLTRVHQPSKRRKFERGYADSGSESDRELLKALLNAIVTRDAKTTEDLVRQVRQRRSSSTTVVSCDQLVVQPPPSPDSGKSVLEIKTVELKHDELCLLLIGMDARDDYLSGLWETLLRCEESAVPSLLYAIRQSLTHSRPETPLTSWPSSKISLERIHIAAASLARRTGAGKNTGLTNKSTTTTTTTTKTPRQTLITIVEHGKLHAEPLYIVSNVKRWTGVVDDETASHLLSLFLTWDNPLAQVVDSTIFLRDLNSGNTRFCSALLLTMMLYYGCNYSYDLDRPWDRSEEKATARSLYAEIQRLWPLEKDTVCLTTAQSSMLLGAVFSTSGKDKIGSQYIEYGALIARKLGIHKASCPSFQSDCLQEAEELSRIQKVLAWTVFDFQAFVAHVYGRRPAWQSPPEIELTKAEADLADAGGIWSPYPFASPVFKPYNYAGLRARYGLSVVVNQIALLAKELPEGMSLSQEHNKRAMELVGRLLAWRKSLPLSLWLDVNPTPINFGLYLYYYTTLHFLCELLCSKSDTKDFSPHDPHKLSTAAIDSTGSLLLLYRKTHGWKSLPIVMQHYFAVVGVFSASKLTPTVPQRSHILECCVSGLWHMSLSWRLCRILLRILELVLEQARPNPNLIPPTVKRILQELRSKVWRSTDTENVEAEYMIHNLPGEGSVDGLENVLRALDTVSLND